MNARLMKLLGDHPDRYPHRIAERFPHIVDAILLLWGEPEMDLYFNRLLMNDRQHLRQGFPPEVAKEIHALRTLHDSLHTPALKLSSIWELVPRR